MKILILFCLQFFLLFSACGQSNSKELGEKIFLAFKHDSINLIQNYRLKIEQLPGFFIANGLDTNSNRFIVYRSKYSAITEKLLNKCKAIQIDTVGNNLSWKTSELIKITLKDQNGKSISDQDKASSKLLEIKFNSNSIIFSLLVEASPGEDKLWKIGNFITLGPTAPEITD